MSEKLWAGRFSKNTDRQVNAFNSSISFDWRMYRQDIRGSRAHAAMLAACGIISKEDAAKIGRGLEEIADDLAGGKLEFDPEAEDIHMFIEAELTRRVGEAGKKLHTGRSRNDQVALDLRMYLRDAARQIRTAIIDLYYTLTGIAGRHLETWMPGYTHMQRAQPISLAHHLMAYVEMFARDIGRLDDCLARMDVMPLGSGALAGTTYPLDREMVAAELGFSSISRNSLDAVSDRDYAIELAAALAMTMMHISRLSEEMILWASQEFGFIELDDAYSTGSSIMPQKKNPDIAELSRGKTGRVYGDLTTLLTMMKGLPLAYNKDMQEDKEAIFDALDTVGLCLPAITGMIRTMTVNKDRLRQAAAGGFTNATDLADYLVAKGISFRDAHNISGQIVRRCISEKSAIEDLDLAALRQYSDKIDGDIYEAISLETCVRRRKLTGGPAPGTVAAAILAAEARFR